MYSIALTTSRIAVVRGHPSFRGGGKQSFDQRPFLGRHVACIAQTIEPIFAAE